MSTLARPFERASWLGEAVARTRAWLAAATAYEAAFGTVMGAALALRLVQLADKPFHHDESEHAWFSWLIVTGHGYHYDPVFHGPVQLYLTTIMYLLFGVGDFVARLAPALVGTALTGLPYLLRRQLGRTAAIVAAVAFCVSPSYLYFSRFAREDIYTACITLALIAAVFRFLARPRPWHPSLVLGLLALSFATKETTYITVFIGGTFFAGALALQARRAGMAAPLIRAVRSVGRDAWVSGLATFAAVYTLLFSTFFTNPRGLQDGIVEGIRYWLSQQPVNRGSQPWFYYLVVVPGYEWPVLVLGLIGIAFVLKRPTLFGAFLVWTFGLSMVVYSWASERMPWLVLHPLLPLVLLAGIGAQVLWGARARLVAKLGLVVAIAGVAYAVQAAVLLSYVRPADPKELLVFTQISTDVPPVRDEILELHRRAPALLGRALTVEIDRWGGVGWPWGWYLRDVPSGYPDMSEPGYKPSADVVVVADLNRPPLVKYLRGYVGWRFRLRVWWVPEWGQAGVADWARWVFVRKPWSPKGTLDEWIYVRRGRLRPRTSTGAKTMNGRKFSAWRTSAYESASESSTP
jgi:uncharacterized protein (TIGR03663 family)